MGERVNVGEADVDRAVPRGDCDCDCEGGSAVERVDEFEKTVRSFCRERAGERRREGMVVVWWCGVEMRVCGV